MVLKSIIYQFFANIFLPPLFHILVIAVGTALVFRKSTLQWGKRVLVSGLLLLCLSSSGFVVHMLSRPLESPYPRREFKKMPADMEAIVVLTGGEYFTKIRIMRAVALHYKFHNLPIVISGGVVDTAPNSSSEAEIAARMAEGLGVLQTRIHVEEYSRNTHENALFTAEYLQRKNINKFFLVTSATHMHRAMSSFRKIGYEPYPDPSDFVSAQSDKSNYSIYSFMPSAQAFNSLFYVLHEYLGLLWYKIMGYI